MQFLLAMNKFSTHRRRLFVKQNDDNCINSTLSMCDVCDVTSCLRYAAFGPKRFLYLTLRSIADIMADILYVICIIVF